MNPPITKSAHITPRVFLDVETTGLNPAEDEIAEIAIYGRDGSRILDTLVRPVRKTSWPEAQSINGIAPADVADAATLAQIAFQIRDAVRGAVVVAYNSRFDAGFLGELLNDAAGVECCMLQFADFRREWDEYHGNWRWFKLDDAARFVRHDRAKGQAHRAGSDALACRSVWLYMNDPAERERVDALIRIEEIADDCNEWVESFWRQRERAIEQKRDIRRGEIVDRLRRVVGQNLDETYGIDTKSRLDDICRAVCGVGSEHYHAREQKSQEILDIIERGAMVVSRVQDLPATAASKSVIARRLRALRLSTKMIDQFKRYVLMTGESNPWSARVYYDGGVIEEIPLAARIYISRAQANADAGAELETATELRRRHISTESSKFVTLMSHQYGGEFPLYRAPKA